MFTHEHYVPVLKWKQGEYLALQPLPANIRARITPVFEIQNVAWNYVTNTPAKTLLAHLTPTALQISTNWGQPEAFLDVSEIPPGSVVHNGQYPLRYLWAAGQPLNLQLIPVVRTTSDPQLLGDAQYIVQTGQTGAAFRLTADDFSGGHLRAQLAHLMAVIGVTEIEVDILLDLGNIPASVGASIFTAMAMLQQLPTPGNWRTVTLLSGAFPINLSGMAANSVTRVARTDWQLYTTALAQLTYPRIPTFGDYAISHPEIVQMDPRQMTVSGSIRYTADQAFVIVKGHSTKVPPRWAQMVGLASTMIAQPEYVGPAFSAGDAYISQCAQGQVGHGNATVWRRVGTNHHLVSVVHQVANHFGFLP